MIETLVLVSWVVAGAVIAAVFVDETESRWAWAPMAVVFGPLWLLIAVEQRSLEPEPVTDT